MDLNLALPLPLTLTLSLTLALALTVALALALALALNPTQVIMKPIPNLATPETPAAFIFGYMYANPSQDAIIKKYWPEGSSAALDPVGP